MALEKVGSKVYALIPDLPEASDVRAGDKFIMHTTTGTMLLNFNNLILPLDNVTFGPQFTEVYDFYDLHAQSIEQIGTGEVAVTGAPTNCTITDGLNKLSETVDNLSFKFTEYMETVPTTITGAASSIVSNKLNVNRVVISDSAGNITNSAVTSTEVGYLTGIRSNVQRQIDNAVSKTGNTPDSYLITDSSGTVTTSSTGGIGSIVGEVKMYLGTVAPDGYLLCNGAEVSRQTYARLFDVIGIRYGGGDGISTFNLPDLRGMFIRGAGENEFDTQRQGKSLEESMQMMAEPTLPNIIGTFAGVGQYYDNYNTAQLTGPFYRYNTTHQPAGGVKIANAGAERDDIFGFDASKVSSVYKNETNDVCPVNMAVNYIIKY